MDSGERGKNLVATTSIINRWKDNLASRESNQWPPVLKSWTLPAELHKFRSDLEPKETVLKQSLMETGHVNPLPHNAAF